MQSIRLQHLSFSSFKRGAPSRCNSLGDCYLLSRKMSSQTVFMSKSCWRPLISCSAAPLQLNRTACLTSTLRRVLGVFSSRRCITTTAATSREFCGPQMLARFRRRDGMPSSYTLIYRSDMPSYLLAAQIFAFLTGGALITAGLTSLIMEQEAEEAQREKSEKTKQVFKDKRIREEESDLSKGLGKIKQEMNVTSSVAPPLLDDIAEGGPLAFGVLMFSLVVIAGSLFRLQRTIPVRIYSSPKSNYCIAVFYGHILPGRLTQHEFLAGTVRPHKRKLDFLSGSALFKDGSGKEMVIFEHFFRNPSDFNYIMGFEEFTTQVLRESRRNAPK